MNWKDGLAAICTPVSGTDGEYGTAFPVADNVLMTARHVVRPAKRDRSQRILIRWWWSSDGWREAEDDDALIIWESETHDLALLKHPRPVDVEGSCILPLNPIDPRPHLKWEGAGYPAAARIDGEIRPADFQGKLTSKASKQLRFALTPDDYPEQEDAWGGASGMPVVVNGMAIGVVSHAHGGFSKRRLEAWPVSKACGDPLFSKHIPTLADLADVKDALCESLLAIADNEPMRKVLVRELGVTSTAADSAKWARMVADQIAAQAPGEAFSSLARASQSLGSDKEHVPEFYHLAKSVAPLFARALLPGFDAQISARKEAGFGIIDAPISTLTLAEIIVANACDRRHSRLTDHVSRNREDDEPPGVHWIPFEPKLARDDKGGRIVAAALSDLTSRYGLRLDPADPANAAFGDAAMDALHEAFELDAPDLDGIRRRIRTAISARRGCPYVAVKTPDDSNDAAYLLGELTRLSELIPELPIIVMSREGVYDETLLGGFRFLIPQKET